MSDSAFGIGAGANHLGLKEGTCMSKHRRRPERLESRRSLGRNPRRLVQPALAGEPLGEVELDPCRPVRVVEVAERFFSCLETCLNTAGVASRSTDERAGTVQLRPEEGRGPPGRPGRDEIDELFGLFDGLQGQGGIDRDREAVAKGYESFAGTGRGEYPLSFIESSPKVTLGEGDETHSETMGNF
jgi:hypothetical protein